MLSTVSALLIKLHPNVFS